MMKGKLIIILISISIILVYNSCYYRLNCDSSKSVKLGEIDYSVKFKEFNIEKFQDTISFSSTSNNLIFIRKSNPNKKPRRYNEYKVCEKIDIKPTQAYAYYEYKNLNSTFLSDSGILVIGSEITKEGNKRGESLYLSISTKGIKSIKGRVPISNIDTTKTYSPYGELFSFFEHYKLGDKELEDIWIFRKKETAIYYSKKSGIIALEGNGIIYFRD